MTFGGAFSYLNNTVYGLTINANLDFRIENIQGMPGNARVFFTDGTLPYNTSNLVPIPPRFTIVDSFGNNVTPQVLNGITCFVIHESRGYTMSLNGQAIFRLRTQIQQCTILTPGMNHFYY
ncbi:hypothetical protein C1645_816949 [Glomus cerebriforme]|uniref:Uncharacterized protein n=1 Tax=Glomus cerebriforme TaxID=658196 RepID=A0A397TAC3_9GLOM|nr:hypothetical protein C1645_816949 [Glomus cerebriforme]